jgi:hypothetical protein
MPSPEPPDSAEFRKSLLVQHAHCIKGPVDVSSEEHVKYWHDHSSAPAVSPKAFGTPLHRG